METLLIVAFGLWLLLMVLGWLFALGVKNQEFSPTASSPVDESASGLRRWRTLSPRPSSSFRCVGPHSKVAPPGVRCPAERKFMDTESHPLVQPRLVTAVGLAALGGIGIGLMAARVLILVGFVLALCSALGILWLYFQHLRSAYRALANRALYEGPDFEEIGVALFLIVMLVCISVPLYRIVSRTEVSSTRARLVLGTIEPRKLPGQQDYRFFVTIPNKGNLTAENTVIRIRGKFSESILQDEETDKTIADMVSEAKKMIDPPNGSQIQPGTAGAVTIPDLAVSEPDWAKFSSGNAALHTFAVFAFSDGAIGDDQIWVYEQCGYYTRLLSYWHNCSSGHNSLNKMQKSDFR